MAFLTPIKPYRTRQPLCELVKNLPAQDFVRCHREYIVNLNRVRALVSRTSFDYDFRLDPPLNSRIPIARARLGRVRQLLDF